MPQRVAKHVPYHLGLMMLCLLIPPGLDHPAISNRAAHGTWNTRNHQALEPITELAVRVWWRGGICRRTEVQQANQPRSAHRKPRSDDYFTKFTSHLPSTVMKYVAPSSFV